MKRSTAIIRFITPILVLVVTAIVVMALFKSRPVPIKSTAFTITPTVDVQVIEPGTHAFIVHAKGVVKPSKQATLSTEVGGRVLEQNPELDPGGLLNEDEEVLRIDPRDYELNVEQGKAQVATAQMNLEIERGKKRVAQREWALLGEELGTSKEGKNLALRKPQVAAAKAGVKSARSGLKKAELGLERTRITAPFNALVLSTSTETGQLLTPQSAIATIVGSDTYWVQASLPVHDLAELLERSKDTPVLARVHLNKTREKGPVWKGSIARVLPDLEPQGRLARVLIEIPDPLGLKNPKDNRPPLLLGSYVSIELETTGFKDAYNIPRSALTDNNTVWAVDSENTLQEKSVTVARRTEDGLIVTAGLTTGEVLVISPLATPIPGRKVKRSDMQDETDDATPEPTPEARP